MTVKNVNGMFSAPQQKFNARQQYFATIAANLIALSHGCIIGWVSPALPKLASDSTPLNSGPLTNDQVSWIGSINCIGGLLGSISFGYLTALLGSKRAVLFLSIPVVSFWLFIHFGTMYYHILLARFIGGFTGGGVQSSILLFVSEISNDDIRGRLGSVTLFLRNIGTLIGFILGASIDYAYIPIICVIIPIIFLVIFLMIPNSPRYYLSKGKTQKAEEVLRFYKCYNGRYEQEDEAVRKEFERLKSIMSERKVEEKLQLSDFCNRSAIKGLGIGIVLSILVQLSACFAIVNYAVMTFSKIGTTIDPYISSIVLALVLTIGSLTTTYLADKLGRKTLILISLTGSSCGLLATALFYYFKLIGYDLSSYAWLPVVSLSFVIFLSSAGITPLALICSVEYLPSKIRTYGMAIICFSLSLDAFVSVKVYPILLELVDLHGCFIIYGVGCIIGSIFVIFVMRETSGQSLDDVGVNEKPISKCASHGDRSSSVI